MYKNVKKKIEILRSELTFLMDLYIIYVHEKLLAPNI